MGLLDLLKPKQKQGVEPTQAVSSPDTAMRNYLKDSAGLLPHEILMLSYVEQYAKGKEPARFWEKTYGVTDVPGLIRSLEARGFCKDGVLTDAGRADIQNNQHVLYMHRHKSSVLDMNSVCIAANKRPDIPYRDIIWSEYNRATLEYMKNWAGGYYRQTKYEMAMFLKEENRYRDAFQLLAEVVFIDLNGSQVFFDVPPGIIKELRGLQIKLDMASAQIEEITIDSIQGYAPQHRNFSNAEIAKIVVAYSTGNDEVADQMIERKKKKLNKTRA